MIAHEAALKAQARRLRSALAEENVMLGHRKTLDLIARIHGWRNWHDLDTALENETPMAFGLTQSPLPRSLNKELNNMATANDGYVPEYLHSTLISTDNTPIQNVFDSLPDQIGKWKRDPETEERALRMGGRFIHYIRQDSKLPLLAFSVSENGRQAEVVNIVPPPDGKPITLKEANKLEQELIDLLKPLLPTTIKVKQGAPEKHLRDLVSEKTYHLLAHHSANKSTGNSHPSDRARWLGFVAAAAQEGMDDRDEHRVLVRQALMSEGFSEPQADRMSQEFAIQIEAMLAVM